MELWQEILLKTGFALGVISVVMGIAAYSSSRREESF